MTKLKDWFHVNRKNTSIRQMSKTLGISYVYALRVTNGLTRPSVKLAKKIAEYTKDSFTWYELIEESEAIKANLKKLT